MITFGEVNEEDEVATNCAYCSCCVGGLNEQKCMLQGKTLG